MADTFVEELARALSQKEPLPEPKEVAKAEKTDGEARIGTAAPPVQALVCLYLSLCAKAEAARDEDESDLFADKAELVRQLALGLANLESAARERPVSDFGPGWALLHDPAEYISIITRA